MRYLGGEGIADGACDCAGNVLDECGVCGGDGIADGVATAPATSLTSVASVAVKASLTALATAMQRP